MKIARFKSEGIQDGLGVVKGERIFPIGAFASMIELINAGAAGLDAARKAVSLDQTGLSLESVRLLAPVERPGKYLATGLNYANHNIEAKKFGIEPSEKQIWFNKQITCITGPYDGIDPGVTEQLDYEVELGVVIGKRCRNVSAENARECVFGYFVANDVSARDWQFHSSTFTMGKSFDTHGPIGPWIVTTDEIPDPHSLALRCFVNGQLRQSNNTCNMIHSIWQQIAYLTTAFTLEPGDLIATGTPEGVGAAMDPPVYLKPGDVVRCEIDGIGAIENRIVRG